MANHRFHDMTQVEKSMRRAVNDAAELLFVPNSAAVLIMRHFKWDMSALNDRYFGNEDSVMQACGVHARCTQFFEEPERAMSAVQNTKNVSCPICFEDGDIASMACGHGFCGPCWDAYIQNAVSEGPRCVYTTCPHPKCPEVVTEEEVAKLSPASLSQFTQYQVRSFVETHHLMRWCPGASCGRVAVASPLGIEGDASCKCGAKFCLQCGESSHSPITCDHLTKWNTKCNDESENVNWILAKTKPCPSCKARIEKNQGCNHMTCSRCRHEFCWICMGNWRKHQTCNKFMPEEAETEVKNAQLELDRYLHCYKRYHAHSDGQTFAEGQLRTFLLQAENDGWNLSGPHYRIFKDALAQLVECRRALKFSYVVSYYMTQADTKTKDLFDDQQQMLETFTERLSELSEKPSTEVEQLEVINHTRVVKQFAKQILDGAYLEIDQSS